jgi:hypothetical protein
MDIFLATQVSTSLLRWVLSGIGFPCTLRTLIIKYPRSVVVVPVSSAADKARLILAVEKDREALSIFKLLVLVVFYCLR